MESDEIIEAAEQELAALDAERREIADFIARYKRYKGMAVGIQKSPSAPIFSPARRSAPADKVMSAVHDILTERKDALTLTAIFDALVSRGVVIGGKHPKQNLSQKLSAHSQIKSYGKRGWYFADALPPSLKPIRQLCEDDVDYEEGPDADAARPLQANGAADWYSA